MPVLRQGWGGLQAVEGQGELCTLTWMRRQSLCLLSPPCPEPAFCWDPG